MSGLYLITFLSVGTSFIHRRLFYR